MPFYIAWRILTHQKGRTALAPAGLSTTAGGGGKSGSTGAKQDVRLGDTVTDSNPEIAAVWRTQTMPDDPVKQSNTRGFVAYAMTGPNARTTQIYIVTGDRSRQDKDGFAPFGKVVDGMDVVDKLYAGYGETAGGGMRGGKQARLFEGGNGWLDKEFPRLDKLLSAAVM